MAKRNKKNENNNNNALVTKIQYSSLPVEIREPDDYEEYLYVNLKEVELHIVPSGTKIDIWGSEPMDRHWIWSTKSRKVKAYDEFWAGDLFRPHIVGENPNHLLLHGVAHEGGFQDCMGLRIYFSPAGAVRFACDWLTPITIEGESEKIEKLFALEDAPLAAYLDALEECECQTGMDIVLMSRLKLLFGGNRPLNEIF